MGILSGLKPQKVFEFFELCSSVPHGSGNTKQVSDICVNFARERGLEVYQDEVNDVIIKKPATPGYENSPAVILQGHLDMVCAKYPEDDIDMSRDPIKLMTDGEYVWAHRTSLGGDDMIAVAMALAILDDDTLEHPAIEALFTVDEETGMNGAIAFDPALISGRLLLNMDSEEYGVITAGCAGGIHATCDMELERTALPAGMKAFSLTVGGLLGGHSGAEIQCQRGNSNLLCARILYRIAKKYDLRLASLEGGTFVNVIPSKTVAVFALDAENAGAATKIAENVIAEIKGELEVSDPGFYAKLEAAELPADAVTGADSLRLLTLLSVMPNGVQSMSMALPGLVQTSLSMGILRLQDKKLYFNSFIRSSVESEKFALADRARELIAAFGGKAEIEGEYPAWQYRIDSPLRDRVLEVFRKLEGRDAVVFATHGGLECGILSSKLPGLDCIAFGPDMYDIHSVNEKLGVESVDKFYTLVCEVLKALK